ncbi:MAG TPA: hypothetical protein VLG40_03485 [Candidatus Saccharimonas sp.]|nr:hypothetical protein [Candidatus Saccharimonas sp.]
MTKKQLPGLHRRPVAVTVGKNVHVNPTARFGRNVTIGNDVSIGAACHVGDSCVIGDGVKLRSNVTLGRRVTLLGAVTIRNNCVIGNESVLQNCTLQKGVMIGDNANCNSVIMQSGTYIGENFTIYGYSNFAKTTVYALIGDDVSIEHIPHIGGKAPCYIDDGAQIEANWRASDGGIGSDAHIGANCRISLSNIGHGSKIAPTQQCILARFVITLLSVPIVILLTRR